MKSLFMLTAVGIILATSVAMAEEKAPGTSGVGVNNTPDCAELVRERLKKNATSDAAATSEEGDATKTGEAK